MSTTVLASGKRGSCSHHSRLPEDRFAHIRTRCDDYLKMGAAEGWIFDPAGRVAMILHRDGTMTTHREGVHRLEGTGIEVPLAELFCVLDA